MILFSRNRKYISALAFIMTTSLKTTSSSLGSYLNNRNQTNRQNRVHTLSFNINWLISINDLKIASELWSYTPYECRWFFFDIIVHCTTTLRCKCSFRGWYTSLQCWFWNIWRHMNNSPLNVRLQIHVLKIDEQPQLQN